MDFVSQFSKSEAPKRKTATTLEQPTAGDKINDNVEARARRNGWKQVQDVAGSADGCDYQQRPQCRCQETLHHFGEGDQLNRLPLACVGVTWSWPPSRRASLISGRRPSLPLSSGSGSLGVERMASSCTSKVSALISSYVSGKPIRVLRYRCPCLFNGSTITGPTGKVCADLWPEIVSTANAIVFVFNFRKCFATEI
ncbi:hypothetical protein MLD38_021348 [Melastoma candidum]|uniref:Uncharacterized protein n=1 Tax=Melastoma candidum TaxID=119954 RepID=A0ACB9QFZ2_9MYRT|nr:hypothetical protein MLD38_021348 [Melastoma candidum]